MFRRFIAQALICCIHLAAAGYGLSSEQYVQVLRQLSIAVVLLTVTNGLISNINESPTAEGLTLAVKAYALLIVWRVLKELHREGVHILDTFPCAKK